ncbi:paeninodin family lasso peptide [Paenibacillus thailandensis]|uniref:Paeninodin family lasso peptide n=1 Tax=Paenibacillus thailandensis TaxID=393250 RepID=A0ABW5QY41_9BACL
MDKKEWAFPKLDVLEVAETMAGNGFTIVDYSYIGGDPDFDLYDS